MDARPATDGTTPDVSDPARVVANAWQDQFLWSAVASELTASIQRWRLVVGAAGVAGLFFTVLAGTMTAEALRSQRTVLTTLGVVLLAAVPFVRQNKLSAERIRNWTLARNVSELLKEAIYRHLMGVLVLDAPADGSPPPDPKHPATLLRRCRAIKATAIELAGLAAVAQVPPRQGKTELTLDEYLADRVEGQIAYYRRSGEREGGRARRLRAAEFGLGLAAVALGALSGADVPPDLPAGAAKGAVAIASLVPWVTLVAAAGTAVSAHLAATRSEDLANKYYATHDLLKSLRDEWRVTPAPRDPEPSARLVDAIERAITSETVAWLADWTKAQKG